LLAVLSGSHFGGRQLVPVPPYCLLLVSKDEWPS
jgi:hypothetical protein